MNIILLSIFAFSGATISGVIGMGGGVLLLSLMTFALPLHVIIPIHGLAQLTSNFSRTYILRKHIRKDIFVYFLLGLPLGFLIAYYALSLIPQSPYLYLILSIFIFYTIFKPKVIPSFKLEKFQWCILGLFASLQGALIGATGPLIAPFFLREDLTKEQIIATKSSVQILVHLLKVPLFLSLSFNYFNWKFEIILMCVSVIIGTNFGVKILLKKVDDKLFRKLFKIVLFIAASRLLYKFYSELQL